jgi:hypothetical protein
VLAKANDVDNVERREQFRKLVLLFGSGQIYKTAKDLNYERTSDIYKEAVRISLNEYVNPGVQNETYSAGHKDPNKEKVFVVVARWTLYLAGAYFIIKTAFNIGHALVHLHFQPSVA